MRDIGLLFLVPTGDGRAAVGQVVGHFEGDTYFFALFDQVVDIGWPRQRTDGSGLALNAVMLFAPSYDDRIKSGRWTVIGTAPVAESVALPAYQESVGPEGRVFVVDYSGTRRRIATAAEASRLPYREIFSSGWLEGALRAKLGLDDWVADFDDLLPTTGPTTADLFPE